jgi:hypothetical protein
VEVTPSCKRLLWKLLIVWIAVSALLIIWIGFGRGDGSTGTSEGQVPSAYSASPWLKYARPPQHVPLKSVSPGAPMMTAWIIDIRAALWEDLSRPAFIPASP